MRDELHQHVRQARVPPSADDRRAVGPHGPLRDQPERSRLQQRHPGRHRGGPAIGAVPLPAGVRDREPRAGERRAAHVVRDGVAPVVLPLGLDARRRALRRRRRRLAQDGGPDRDAGDAPARRSEGAPGDHAVLRRVDGRRRGRERSEGPDRLRRVHAPGHERDAAGDALVRRVGDLAVRRQALDAAHRPGGVREPVARPPLRHEGRHRRHGPAGAGRPHPARGARSRSRA